MKSFKQMIDETGRCWPGHRPVPGKKPYSPGSCTKEEVEELEENKSGDSSLHDWFTKSRSSDGKPGWVQLGGRYAGKSCAKQPGQTTKPKCGSSKMAANMSDKEEDAAARRKRMKDPDPNRKGKAINVATEEYVSEDACTTKVKSRYSVWPSAYASGALVRCRKVGAANWGNKTKKEDVETKSFKSFIGEAANAAQQAAIAINMKKKGIKPKNEEVELDEITIVKTNKEIGTRVSDIGPGGKEYNVKTNKASEHGTPVSKKPKGEYESKVEKYLKKKYNKEEVELTEGRPSQRHPLEGHEYHKKTDAELEYIGKDAHKAAEAMKGHNEKAENKYRDQANDAATVRYFRKKSGTPDWYKKKYGHVKEEVELDESEAWTRKEGQNQSGGLNQKGVDSYRAAHPGSKLSTAVTTKPSKLKAGSKAANRRKSFCARMGGLKRRMTSSKTAHDPNSRVNKALRKWNC